MNADGKIYIIVTDKLPAGSGNGGGFGGWKAPSPGTKEAKDEKEEDLVAHWARAQLLSAVKRTAASAVNFSISNIGNFTGNYALQTRVQETIAMSSAIAGIGASALAGFKVTGSPIGAVIGASIAILNQGVQTTESIITQMAEQKRVNRQLDQLRTRAGLNVYTDGSRGTEN